MPVLLITYELAGTGRTTADHARLRQLIGAFGPWAQLTDRVYLVQTVETPEHVRDALLSELRDAEDRVFVGALGDRAAWHNVIAPSTWLKAHL